MTAPGAAPAPTAPAGSIDLSLAPPFRLGGLEVRPPTREVRAAGGTLHLLEPRVMQVLVALAQAEGAVISRDALVARCWDGRIVGDDAINRAVAKARQVASLATPAAFSIEAIPRVGYRLTPHGAPASIEPTPTPAPAGQARPRLGRAAMAAGLLAALAILVVVLMRWTPNHAPRSAAASSAAGKAAVTALPFETLGVSDPELARFVGGLQAKIVNQLNQSHVSVVEPAQAATAAYGLGGAVERDGKDLVVRLKLDDLRQHTTVWSEELRQAAGDATVLQDEVSNLAAHVATTAANEDGQAKGDTETIGLMIRQNLYALRNSSQAREEEWNNDRLLLGRLPSDARVHANFAIVSAFLAISSSSASRSVEMKATAAHEATAALKIDPGNDEAYFARFLIYPTIGPWAEREGVLLSGLKAAPQSGLLSNHYSNFLREVGRTREAVELGRRTAAQRPASANRDASLLLGLAATASDGEASELAARIGATYPEHPAAWNSRFETLLLRRRWADAAALLAPGVDRSGMDEPERDAWTLALKAMKGGADAEKQKAIAAFEALPPAGAVVVQPPHEIYNPSERIGMVAMLGGVDQAYAMASAYLGTGARADASFLFWPTLADFRRDPRFHGLVQAAGLTAYWKATGKWPDVCADEPLPEACRAP